MELTMTKLTVQPPDSHWSDCCYRKQQIETWKYIN